MINFLQRIPRRLRRSLLGIVIFLALYTITGFLILPPIARNVAVKKISASFHRQASIESLKFNPYTLVVDIKGFALKEKKGGDSFASFERLSLNIGIMSLFRKGIILKEVSLQRPYLHFIRYAAQSYNFSDLLAPRKEKKTPLLFSVNNIRISGGKIEFDDIPEDRHHEITDLLLTVPFISNVPYYVQTYVRPEFSARINGTPVHFAGETKPFAGSHETVLDVSVTGFDIPYYFAYLPFRTNYVIRSGEVDTQLRVSYIQYKDRKPSLAVKGSLDLRDIGIVDADQKPLFGLSQAHLEIKSADFFKKNVHLSVITLQAPSVTVKRDEKGSLNFKPLRPGAPAEAPAKDGQKPMPFALVIDKLQMNRGKAVISDSFGHPRFATTLSPVDCSIKDFSTEKGKQADYEIDMKSGFGEHLHLSGLFSVNPRASTGSFALSGLALSNYSPYYADRVKFSVDGGILELAGNYRYAADQEGPEVAISGLSSSLKDLLVRDEMTKAVLFRIPEVYLKGGSADMKSREISLQEVASEGGIINVERLQNGRLNMSGLMVQKKGGLKGSGETVRAKPWVVRAGRIDIRNYTANAKDSVPQKPVRITAKKIDFGLDGLSTEKDAKTKISLSCGIDGGHVSASGRISLSPLSGQIKTRVEDLDILPVREYIGDRVKIRITGGKASASGTIGFGKEGQGNFDISYKGDAGVAGFSSVDKSGETFLTWESLEFKDMNIRDSFGDILIKGITLSQFYSRIVVQPDGVLNVLDMTEKKTEGKKAERPAEGAAAEKKTERRIVVESTTLQGGAIHFTDDHIKPRYEAFLAKISGRMTRLATSENKPADLDLLAKFNAYAPLEITGKVNPFGTLLVDLKIDFKDMDMTPLNPYATRYIGYTIEKGKVAFNLKYEIVKTKLNAQNNIFFDQLTLGQKVESPQAVKLPVKFAISLLKNRKGEINLDVPVSGDLSSPKFSIGDVILKAIGKFITRIVTSPFSLIASLFGGGSGEHLAYLEFDAGKSVIEAQQAKKLDTLIKGLHERPHLKLDIAGYADPKRDREELRQERFQRKLKEQKLKDMTKQGKPPLPINQITIGPEEKDKYLWEAYRKEKFPRPTNILGMVKKLPAEEMEKLIITHIDITDQDLRQLASDRATAARDYILKSGKVDPERLFLVEEKKVVPPEKKGVSESRVEFTLE